MRFQLVEGVTGRRGWERDRTREQAGFSANGEAFATAGCARGSGIVPKDHKRALPDLAKVGSGNQVDGELSASRLTFTIIASTAA
jgi:hypothetical protein